VVALTAVAGACSGDDGAGGRGRVTVVASFYPLAEVAERVGGGAVDVTNLTPAGTEPHDVELSSRQVDDLLDADLVVYLGGGFQPAVEDVLDRRDGPGVDALEHLAVAREDREVDPHVWLDPRLLQRIVDAVTSGLADVVPDARADLGAAADRYRTELADLDTELARRLGDCERHEIVTAHAAFHYLAARYGLRQEAVAGLSPEAEPDPGRLADLADLVRRDGGTTVFTETLAAPDVAETLAREAGVRTAVLDPIEGLSPGEERAGETYASIMRTNGDVLAEALGCR